ncbi:MAG: shikimate dehydrogenase [Lachnospiraceae bacterium]|nr:shikimate dehydrogenase [Lachnospiraceae bacterium]
MEPVFKNDPAVTARFAVIGHPVAHSKSPLIHNSAFRLLSLNAAYGLLDTDEAALPDTVKRMINEPYTGWNVTMPCKTRMSELCDEISVEARIARAVNTVSNRNGHLYGDTTDGKGFLFALATMGISVENEKLTLLGGGGAASAMLITSALAGAREIAVFCRSARSAERVQDVAARIAEASSCRITLHDMADTHDLKVQIADSIALANGTSAGMHPADEETPVPADCLAASCAVFDAVYNPLETRLLRGATAAGCPTANGLQMLVGQAAESFKIWTGLDMPTDLLPPLV